MNINPFEKNSTGPDNTKDEKSYQQYLKQGGNINELDYKSALSALERKKTNKTTILDKVPLTPEEEIDKKYHITQAENFARFAGIELHKDAIDLIIILYGILRSDIRPEGVKRHHDEAGDEHIFAEALRMLGDVNSLKKLIEAYKKTNPNMFFKYPEKEVLKEEEKRAA